LSEFERGFRDCDECHGEGIVRRMIPPSMECDVSDIPSNLVEMVVQTEIVACPACEKRRAAITKFERVAAGAAFGDSIHDLAHWLNDNMPVGARFRMASSAWEKLARPYSSDIALFLDRTAYDTLMGNLVGSGWGGWTVERDAVTGNVDIARHACGDKRTYIDRDRAHLFRRVNGELVHVHNIWSAEAVADIARMILTKG
jgi:hypothetical protein